MSETPAIHEERLEELSAYYGGDLSPEAAAAFEAHLAGCERCQETLRVMKTALPTAEAARTREPRTRLWVGLVFGGALMAVVAWAFLRMAAEPTNAPGGQVYAPPQPKIDAG